MNFNKQILLNYITLSQAVQDKKGNITIFNSVKDFTILQQC